MYFTVKQPWGMQKPVPGSQIDWGHPLARGLVGCWLFNDNSRLPKNNAWNDLANSAEGGGSVSPFGLRVINGYEGSGQTLTHSAGDQTCPNTIFWRGIIHAITGKNLYYTEAGNTGSTYTCTDSDNARLKFQVGREPYAQSVYYSPNGSVVANEICDWAQARGHYNAGFYNGLLCGSAGGAITSDISASFLMGRAWKNNEDVTHIACYYWVRCLSPDEIAWLHTEPYAMIQAPEMPIFYSIPAIVGQGRVPFSASSYGRPIQITATGSPGTIVHTVPDDTVKDIIYARALNRTASQVIVTSEWGATGADNSISQLVDAASNASIIPGLQLGPNKVYRAYASDGSDVSIAGYVDRLNDGTGGA